MSLAQSMNLDSVMAHLGKMSPQQLQQFAAMHKDDPIMLAAASSVKNKMDKIAQAGQAQMSGQQPPPVNEQVVESMAPQGGPQASNQLPENSGIGALPAPNMQHMAGGGIVAFADGGYTDEQMMDDNNPVMRMAEGGVARFNGNSSQFVQDVMALPERYTAYQQRVREEDAVKAQREKEMAQRQQDELAARQKTSFANYLFGTPEREATGKAELAQLAAKPVIPALNQASVSAPTPYDPATATRASQYAPATTGAGAGNPGAGNDTTGAGAGNPGAGNATTGATQPRPQPQGGIATIPTQDYRKQYESFLPKETVDRFAQQQENANAAQTSVRQENLTQLREDQAAAGIAGEAKEKRISKREGDLEKQKDLNLNLSLMEAGFATMQSRGKGLAGIGEGATAGLKTYGSGIQRLQAAREKIDDARDQLDDLRRNEANMNRRELRGATNELNQTIAAGQEKVLQGLRSQFGADSAQAMEFAKMTQQSKEGALDRASRERVANMPSGQIQLLTALGGKGGVEAGLRLMTEIQAGKRTIEQSYEDYMKAFAGKDTTVAPPLTAMQYVAQIKQLRAAMDPNKVPGALDGTADRK
jgi:hypothetical protein